MGKPWKYLLPLVLAMNLTAGAAVAEKVKFGVLTDMSGPFSDLSGAGSVEAARLAIEDFGGEVLGEKIELIFADHQHKPDVGLNTARQWYDVDGVDVILDVPNSAIALAVNTLTAEKKKIAIYASAATDRLTEDSCNGYGLHWTFDTYSQTRGAARALIEQGIDTWFLLVADYAYGHSMEEAMREAVTGAGGKIVGSVRHPLQTLDFSSYLLQAQNSGAKIVALASGGDVTINAIKQGREFGLQQGGQRLASLLTFITDVHGLGLDMMQGLQFAVPYYWDMDDQTRAFAKRFHERTGKMPGEAQAGIYSGVLHYLRAVKAVGSKDSDQVLTWMRDNPVEDMFSRHGKLLPNGRMVHDMYLVEVKSPADKAYDWDYYRVVSTIPAERAFRPLSESACPITKGK
ncbi:branched-chain amino acid transport system substrate-binding protein [Pseudochelatococcus lubricantis]|uniref:Branched-chain amino acid transport system substrate-binding protein n=1 Tax=Pseudochelatococcus lubricantis TaxID=1538102 RepID=A0ABX0V3T3_9HYPH|nr:ABC transporter substrate-binding protein [Pseudochelatococcus lubricantis]NIJ59030.1 branched-chain amino acid transport system substrate-binding protein [Pseudochelatococcus lubricantis]